MSIKDDMTSIDQIVDKVVADVHAQGQLSDDDANSIIEQMQAIEDKLSNLLAEFGVEIGDERID